jgi:hypothetical protein
MRLKNELVFNNVGIRASKIRSLVIQPSYAPTVAYPLTSTGAAVATRRKLLRTRSPTIDDVRRVYVQDAVGRWTERDPVAKGVILRSITSTTRRRNRQDKEYFF